MKLEKELMISKVVFENGVEVEVGDVFEDGGYIFKIKELENEIVEVLIIDEEEGYSVYYDKDGNLYYDEDEIE
jgi:hypothetical protein